MILDGKTSAQACGIEIRGQGKWITLIQNARKLSNTLVRNTDKFVHKTDTNVSAT